MLLLTPPEPGTLDPLLPARQALEGWHPVACLDEAQYFARVANWQLDLDSNQVEVSGVWFDIWGFDAADGAPSLQRILYRIHPADRERVVEALRQAEDSGVAFQVRYRILHPDERPRWLESTGHPDREWPHRPRWLRGVVMDITARHEAEQKLARYYEIVSASPDRIAFVDAGGRIQAVNEAFLTAIGETRERIMGQPLREVVGRGALQALLARHRNACLERGRNVVEEVVETERDGGLRALEARLFPHRDASGIVTGVAIMIRDMTAIREAERRLLQSAAVYEATSQGVLIADDRGRIVALNAAFTRITGYGADDLLGRSPTLFNSGWHPPSFFFGMGRRLLRRGTWQGDLWIRRKDGEIYPQRLSIRTVRDPHGPLINFVGVFAEPGSLAAGTRRTEYLAHYDPLTRLPNRLLFDSRVTHALAAARRGQVLTVLLLLDLDHFAHLNSSLGHQIGDEVLRALGPRLRELVRPADTLARLSGNLFGLLLETLQQPEEVNLIVQRLRAALRRPIPAQDHDLFVTASIGIALTRGGIGDRDTLMAHAEIALRIVKEGGRDGVHVYSERPGDAAHDRQHLIERLRAGLDRGDYLLHYRPLADAESAAWIGAEALIRRHPARRDRLSPDRALRLAEDTGFIVELGQWALETACRQLRDWRDRGLLAGARLSLPVAEAQLTQGELGRLVERQLSNHGLKGDWLELAFDESLLIRHREQVEETFAALDRLGVQIVISGVGAGWLAPRALRRLPIRRLAIHREFVERLPASEDDLAVVQAVVSLAQALDLEVLADGVRTDEQRLLLLNIGCHLQAGERFGAPLPADRFEFQLGGPPPGSAPPVVDPALN